MSRALLGAPDAYKRRQQVGFNKEFDFVKGGKLPGMYGGDPDARCTGGQNSPSCFSLRRESSWGHPDPQNGPEVLISV